MSNRTQKAKGEEIEWVPKKYWLLLVPLMIVVGCVFVIWSNNSGSQILLNNQRLKLEIADSESERSHGLSGRDKLAEDEAMLFVFDQPHSACMWMKDMKFSLDMIWLNEDKQVIKIQENISPDTYPESFCSTTPAKYVIELNAGTVQSTVLKTGMKLTF